MNKIIKKRYILTVIIAVIIIYLTVAIVKTKGPVIRIETDVPASDFVLECVWAGSRFALHGGGGRVSNRIAIINSNENFDCGYSFWAGVHRARSYVMVRHPLYTDVQGEDVNGVKVVKVRSKLDVLMDRKKNFELRTSGSKVSGSVGRGYLSTLPGCGIGDIYFDYYSELKDLDLDYFKSAYNEDILKCFEIRLSEVQKYYLEAYEKQPKANAMMKKIWESDRWE